MPPVSIADYRRLARRRLPRPVFDYLDGGAGAELALAGNAAALGRATLTPRVMRNVAARETAVELFGTRHAAPFAIGPTGFNGLVRPGGDLALARAAAAADIPFVLSTAANASVEDVRQAAGRPPWFQLYVLDPEQTERVVARVERAGVSVLVLTVDVPVGGRRLKDLRHGFALPMRPRPRWALDFATRPGWVARYLRGGALDVPNLADGGGSASGAARLLGRSLDASFDWDSFERLRARWRGRLIVKGVLHPDDAARAVSLGADGLVVSNHGGRQLDGAPATLDALPGVVQAAAGRVPVLADGGVRSGEDVAKFLAAGAQMVLLGRATLYALAAAGEAGVAHALDLVRGELDTALALLGCPRASELGAEWRGPAAAAAATEPRDRPVA